MANFRLGVCIRDNWKRNMRPRPRMSPVKGRVYRADLRTQLTEINRLLEWDDVIIDAQKHRVVDLCFSGKNAAKTIELLWAMEKAQEKRFDQFDGLLDQLRSDRLPGIPKLLISIFRRPYPEP